MSKKIKYLFFSLRPEQWVKNLLILVPLIFGKRLFAFPANLKSIIAFFLFFAAAGVVYLINDLFDLKKDIIHPTKRLRPIASGKVTAREARITASLLGALSIGLSFMLNIYFGWIVVIYFMFNFMYSKILKRLFIIDVFCIGCFFLLRVMAGAAVVAVGISHWIIIMILLLSLFLGFNKRRQELMLFGKDADSRGFIPGRYNIRFIDKTITLITALIAVGYIIYTMDARTMTVFGTWHMVYSVPFVYYGVFRYLYLIWRCGKNEEPLRILLTDRRTQLNLALWISVCVGVIYFGF